MLKKFVPIAFLLFLMPIALASSLTLTPVTDQISPYDFASFSLFVNNTGNADKFTISYSDIDWLVETEPLTDYTTGIFVAAGSAYSTTLLVKPIKDNEAVFGRHNLEIKLKAQNSGENLNSVISIDVRRDLIKYPLKLGVDFMMPDNIFPIKTNSIKVKIQNDNLLNITELNVSLKSKLFEKKTSVSLGPKSEKIVDFSVILDGLLPPQKDTATLKVTHGNYTVAEITKQYSVASSGNFLSQSSVKKTFLGEIKTVAFSNNGNSEQTEPVLINAESNFKRLFSWTNPATKVKTMENVPYYTANLTLAPNESKEFTITTSYAPILYVIIILIVAGVLYFALRSPIIAAKEAKEVALEEGGIARLSVLIKVKNRTGKEIKGVKIIEKVPSIARVQIRESETLKPSKTYPYPDGMVMEYHIGKMEQKEVRFISYHLKTKLAIVGSIRLKPVIVQYSDGKKVYSNPVEVYAP